MAVIANISYRFGDLKAHAKFGLQQMQNLNGGMWEKFVGIAPAEPTPVKPADYDIFDRGAIGVVFDKADAVALYKDAYAIPTTGGVPDVDPDTGEPEFKAAWQVISAKRQSDMLASMQQASVLRFTSRLRSVAACASRRKSAQQQDLDNLVTAALDKWDVV